jgi:hypothetical protein
MPLYQFSKENGEIVELFFEMKSAPRIGDCLIVNGEWVTRIPSVVNCKTSSVPLDIYNVDKLAQYSTPNETIGETIERSKELSEKRAAQNGGVDPVKARYNKERKKSFEKRRNFKKKP